MCLNYVRGLRWMFGQIAIYAPNHVRCKVVDILTVDLYAPLPATVAGKVCKGSLVSERRANGFYMTAPSSWWISMLPMDSYRSCHGTWFLCCCIPIVFKQRGALSGLCVVIRLYKAQQFCLFSLIKFLRMCKLRLPHLKCLLCHVM